MLTKEQIGEKALEFKHGEDPFSEKVARLGFVYGAQWANKQNAAEIAELRNVLLSVLEADIAHNLKTGDFALPKSLRDQVFAVLEKHAK